MKGSLEQIGPGVLSRTEVVDVGAAYAEHAEFVWLTLQRMGVRTADLEDVLHEVFIVVHRKLHTFDGRCKLRTWLYSICIRVAAAHRRRGWVRRERPEDTFPDTETLSAGPEERVAQRQAQNSVARALDQLSVEHRAVLVMYEIDELPCAEMADILGVPLGTVHSRLNAARKAIQRALQRINGGAEQ